MCISLDCLGYTPLMRAKARGQDEVVKMLTEAGADINLRNFDTSGHVVHA